MLPLSGEERDGPGSGKCVKTRHRAAAGLSQSTWAQEVPPALRQPNQGQPGFSQNPEQEERTELLGLHPTSSPPRPPSRFLVFLESLSPSLPHC